MEVVADTGFNVLVVEIEFIGGNKLDVRRGAVVLCGISVITILIFIGVESFGVFKRVPSGGPLFNFSTETLSSRGDFGISEPMGFAEINDFTFFTL